MAISTSTSILPDFSVDEDEISPAYFNVFRIPDEVWYKIFAYLDQPSQKSMRAVHPLFTIIMKTVKSFGLCTSYRTRESDFSIFQKILESDFEWGEVWVHLYRSILDPRNSENLYHCDTFFVQYAERVVSLNFFKCSVSLNEDGEQEFFLSAIVDKCRNIKSLTVGGCPKFFPQGFEDEVNWHGIKCLRIFNDSYLTIEFARRLLGRIGMHLEEMSVLGNQWKISGRKGDQKMISKEHLKIWAEECEVILKVFIPFLSTNGTKLKKLAFPYHPVLITETNCHFDLVSLRFQLQNLESVDFAMCDFPLHLLCQLLENIPSIKNLNCSILAYKCRHDSEHSNQYLKYLTKSVCARLESLTINFSKSLTCACFLRNAEELKHVDISYNQKINSKLITFKDRGIHLKSFLFAGNQSAGLRIRELLLWKVTHLDLSFSKAVISTEDINHICEHMRRVEILKLSGSPGQLSLAKLPKLRKLKELRLRSCLNIQPSEFEENIDFPLLETLDLANTLLSYSGCLFIMKKHLRLTLFDVRSCAGIARKSAELCHFKPRVTLLTGKLKEKRKRQYDKLEESKENVGQICSAHCQATDSNQIDLKLENSILEIQGQATAEEIKNTILETLEQTQS